MHNALDGSLANGHKSYMAKRVRPGDPKVAVCYSRVSTGRQELGLDAQRTALESWAAQRGVTIAAWCVDQGVSGSAPLEERPALLEAMGRLPELGAGLLLVARRDRLARDVMVAGLIERAVTGSGAHVCSVDGAGNGQSPTDVFTRTVLDAASELERALIRARTRAALAEKKARNEKLGGRCPYGYRVDDDTQTPRVLVPHAEEQRVIETIRSLRAERTPLRTIVARLAELGVVSRSGRPLALTQVARIAA